MPKAKKLESEEHKKTKSKTEKTEKTSDAEKAEKLAKLKEKAEKLKEKIKEEREIKEIKDDTEQKTELSLGPVEDFLKASMHLGTRAITPDMRQYVYKRRADSLAVFNTNLLDEKLHDAGTFLSEFAPNEIVIVCKREAGEKAMELFSKITGIRTFTKYPAGILTNPNLDTFIETELVLISDPWTDKNALNDAKKIKIPVMAICDTNNYTKDINKIIPGNNKSSKSLGFIFYHLAKIYVDKRHIKSELAPLSEWVENWDNLIPPK